MCEFEQAGCVIAGDCAGLRRQWPWQRIARNGLFLNKNMKTSVLRVLVLIRLRLELGNDALRLFSAAPSFLWPLVYTQPAELV
jgi:hypothetical protein